jgi:hypothetical protein
MNGATLGSHPTKQAATVAAWAFLVLSPFLLLGVLSLAIGKNVFTGVPVWTDELDYWRAVFSFLHAGPAVGYSGIGELHAAVGTLSVHGLTPILLYAGPAALLGWTFSSIMLINGLWVSLGALTFCLLVRPKALTAVAIGVVLMIYTPVVLYAATAMTELANYGLLLFYLAFMTRLIRTRGRAAADGRATGWRAGLPSLVLASLTVLMCVTYRITYVGLWIPLVLAACDFRWSGKMAACLALALLVSAGAYYVASRFTSPFASGFLYNLLRTGSFALSVKMFLSHAKANLMDYFTLNPAHVMEGLQRVLYWAVAALALLGSFLRAERFGGRFRLRVRFGGFAFLSFLTLFIPFALVICFYETNDWSDYRTLAPFLWLVVAAAILRGRRLMPAVFLAGSALVLAVLMSIPPVGMFGDDNRFTFKTFWKPKYALLAAVEYDPAAIDPYQNAVRTDVFTISTVGLLHPGMGIQTGWFTEGNTGKCRWIMTDYLKIPLTGYELVFKNKAGSVYRLIDAPAKN